MISATAFTRWYFVPLFLALILLLAPAARLLVTGALALMASSAGRILSLFSSVSGLLVALEERLRALNAALVLAICVYFVWCFLTLENAGDSDPPSPHSQWHDTANTTPADIPKSEPSFKWTRSTFSKGETSSSTPPTTPLRTPGVSGSTSSARTFDATWKHGDSLRGHGIGHGYEYGQRRVTPITSTSLHSGNPWTAPAHKGDLLVSSPPSTRGYFALSRPSVTARPVPIAPSLDLTPAPPVLKPSPPQLPSPPPTPVAPPPRAEAKTKSSVGPKNLYKISQKDGHHAFFRPQSSARRQARQLKKAPRSCPLPAPLLSSTDVSAQDPGSPMVFEFEDESLLLADRLEVLSITSPRLPCSEKVENALAPLVKMASPIIGHSARNGGPASFMRDVAMEIDQDSDSSDDSVGADFDSDWNADDYSMDVDSPTIDTGDVDMDAWDHPPVQSPLLGNSYAPSLRRHFSGLHIGPIYEAMDVDAR
ncbi:hypothetical protein EYR40_008853 [Pleurotus pulmonarius]|nr:hypothetical protein EYR36_009673 [Pleurotus pulmonarius]KAF4594054.1 hypothetical protein EYR40_008853 [Pleurotus pulmonarius]